MLRVSGLHYRYPEVAVLRGVDLTVAPGEIVSLVGPNGAGKSTLLKCINRILRPNEGVVEFEGRAVESYRRRDLALGIAYVPQHAGPAMSLPVIDIVGLGRAPHRGSATASQNRDVVINVIETLGLQSFAFRLFGALSGGERQRVLIARALAQEGRLMLLDEPTNALDLRHQLETMTIVRSIAKDKGIGALIAIHDLSLASRFSDRLVLLGDGRVHAHGAWKDVMRPEHLEAVYGVSAVVGTAEGLPYVIPAHGVRSTHADP